MAIRKPDKEKRPRVLLVPPPDLPVPAVQGGAVETLLTHLIRENEKQGLLELLCASVPDDAARRAAEGWQHTKMLYVPRPSGHRRYWPMVFVERCMGIAAPYDPWYQKVQLSLALELPPPDLIVAEGGNLTQCSAISRMFGRRRCLAHLHGQTGCTPVMDDISGGVLALSEFLREDSYPVQAVLVREIEDENTADEWTFLLKEDKADLDEILTTAFVLNMDSKLLCRPDCKGICPRCGKNLNEGACSCRPEIDPRLAVLGQLLKDK